MCTRAHSKLHSGILPGSKPQHEIQKSWFGPGNRLSADPEWQRHLKLWIFYTDKWRHAVVAVIVTSCNMADVLLLRTGQRWHDHPQSQNEAAALVTADLDDPGALLELSTSQCRSCGWGVRHNSTMGGVQPGLSCTAGDPASSMRVRSFALEELLQSKQEHGFP